MTDNQIHLVCSKPCMAALLAAALRGMAAVEEEEAGLAKSVREENMRLETTVMLLTLATKLLRSKHVGAMLSDTIKEELDTVIAGLGSQLLEE